MATTMPRAFTFSSANASGTGFIEFKPDTDAAPAASITISYSKNVVAGSTVNTGGGNFIVGDSNSPKE